MLRSELRIPPRDPAQVTRWIAFTLLIAVGTVCAGAVLAEHAWTDDHRAEKLREFERTTTHPCTDGTTGVSGQLCSVPNVEVPNVVELFDPPVKLFGELQIENVDSYTATHIDNGGRKLLTYKRDSKRYEISSENLFTKTDIWLSIGPDPTKAMCSKEWCGAAVQCAADIIQDDINHVEFVLPCVDGKVGTWVMTQLLQ
jgi:hypothetical protein